MSTNDEMNEYLKPTVLCDFDNVKVGDKAREIVKGVKIPKDMALKIFYFVRDEIAFGLDYFDSKASHTLEKQRGFCFTKANLQVALLRAAEIQARYHFVHLNSVVAKDLFPTFMYKKLGAVMTHPWCECHLSEGWVACDTTIDDPLLKGCVRKGLRLPTTIDWDGQDDLIPFKPLIVKDIGTFSSLDDAISELAKERDEGLPQKPPKILGEFLFFIINRYINKIRNA
jgi:transglutaminase-like putative cysteine protease